MNEANESTGAAPPDVRRMICRRCGLGPDAAIHRLHPGNQTHEFDGQAKDQVMANRGCYPTGGRCHSHDKPLLFCEDHRTAPAEFDSAGRVLRAAALIYEAMSAYRWGLTEGRGYCIACGASMTDGCNPNCFVAQAVRDLDAITAALLESR